MTSDIQQTPQSLSPIVLDVFAGSILHMLRTVGCRQHDGLLSVRQYRNEGSGSYSVFEHLAIIFHIYVIHFRCTCCDHMFEVYG
jgi:hypothetical protein